MVFDEDARIVVIFIADDKDERELQGTNRSFEVTAKLESIEVIT